MAITEPTADQPEPTPAGAPAAADASIIAYQGFVADHDPDVSAWSPANFAEFRALAAKVRARVRRQSDGTWTVLDTRTGQPTSLVFGSAVAAATWLETGPVAA